jgi:hypothetical protein
MSISLFAFLSEAREELIELGKNVLLVAGGYLVGYVVGVIGTWSFNKWAFRKKAPEGLQRFCRHLCGALLALLVALIVFTGKGKPGGDGGEGKGSSSTDTSPGKNAPPKLDANPHVEPKISVPRPDTSPPELTIRVTVLAGAAVPAEGKFYVLDDDSREHAKTLGEIKRVIKERKANVSGKVSLVILFPTDPNLAPANDDKKVTNLTTWAKEDAGLEVTFPATR